MTTTLLQSATDVAASLRRRELSSRELTDELLARIELINPRVNAVVEVRRDGAFGAADDADRALARRDVIGPLHGVPMTVKESFRVEGLHSTWGVAVFADHVADRDATVVRRLRDAGALVVGTTNVAAMLADFGQSDNEVHGRTRNPWDTSRSPGGSSGGAAAAVAAGLSFLEYGSDVVGSLRIPAAFCGVYGLRPTVGTVPTTGMQPPGPPAPATRTADMLAVGPLARTAADLRAALCATAGPEQPAAKAFGWRLCPSRHTRLPDFRVGFVLDSLHAPVSSEVTSVLSDVVDGLARAGTTLVEGWPDGVDPVAQEETFGFHVGLFLAHLDPGARLPDPTRIVAQEHARAATRAAWTGYFSDVDLFLSPATVTPATPLDDRPLAERTVATPEGDRPYDSQAFWSAHASLSGLPTVVAPAGHTRLGLPVGVQLVGPAHEDDTAITFAELLTEVAGGYRSPLP